jgi:hypothetical protein
MKCHHPLRIWSCLSFVLIVAFSCKKNNIAPPLRTVTYVLYTDRNFSNDFDTIRFRLLMKAGDQTLLDSSLAPMTIAQVPGPTGRITIQKTVPESYRNRDLLIGFIYFIDNVGESWYLDTSRAGNISKTVEYNFQ